MNVFYLPENTLKTLFMGVNRSTVGGLTPAKGQHQSLLVTDCRFTTHLSNIFPTAWGSLMGDIRSHSVIRHGYDDIHMAWPDQN